MPEWKRGRPGRSAAYSYDAWYRVTSADLDAGGANAEKLSFTYDSIDNLLPIQKTAAPRPPSEHRTSPHNGATEERRQQQR